MKYMMESCRYVWHWLKNWSPWVGILALLLVAFVPVTEAFAADGPAGRTAGASAVQSCAAYSSKTFLTVGSSGTVDVRMRCFLADDEANDQIMADVVSGTQYGSGMVISGTRISNNNTASLTCVTSGRTFDREWGQLIDSEGTIYGASNTSFPTNYVEVTMTCNLAAPVTFTGYYDHFTVSNFSIFGLGSGTSPAIELNGYGCDTLNGVAVGTLVGLLCSDNVGGLEAFFALELLHFGYPFLSSLSPCQQLPAPEPSPDPGAPFTVEPGTAVTYSVGAPSEEPDFDFSLIDSMSFRWEDQLSFLPGERFPSSFRISLSRSSFLAAVSSLAVEVKCDDAEGSWYRAGSGEGWLSEPNFEPGCGGVLILTDLSGTHPAGEPAFVIEFDVQRDGVQRIKVVGGPNSFTGTLSNGTDDLDLGVDSITFPTYDEDFELRGIDVTCTDQLARPVQLTFPTDYLGGNGRYFKRPVGEPGISECFSGAGIGVNPTSWVPALSRSATCAATALLVPGEFDRAAYAADFDGTSFASWFEPVEPVRDFADRMSDASLAPCTSTFGMPEPIPDIEVDQCDGPIEGMRNMSRTLSSLLIGLWGMKGVQRRWENMSERVTSS